MTAVITALTRRRSRFVPVPPVDAAELGPWSTGFAMAFVVLGTLQGLQTIAEAHVYLGVVWLGLAVGAALLAPRTALERLPISVPWLAFFAWVVASSTWTESPVTASFPLKRDPVLWIGFALVGGLLPADKIMRGLVLCTKAVLVITSVAVITLPSARIHFDPLADGASVPGWHGLFDHKNVMAPALVFGLIVSLLYERRPLVRLSVALVIGILLVGSQSVTGLATALVAMVTIWWLRIFAGTDARTSASFIATSIAAAVAVAASLFASLQTIVQVAGKDLTFSGRTDIWLATWHAIAERPVIGYGLGGLFSVPPTAITNRVNAEIGFNAPHAHSGVLDLLAQFGIVGAVLFGWFMVAWLISSIRVFRIDDRLGTASIALWVMLVVSGLSESVLGGPWFGISGLFVAMNLRILHRSRRARLLWLDEDDEFDEFDGSDDEGQVGDHQLERVR